MCGQVLWAHLQNRSGNELNNLPYIFTWESIVFAIFSTHERLFHAGRTNPVLPPKSPHLASSAQCCIHVSTRALSDPTKSEIGSSTIAFVDHHWFRYMFKSWYTYLSLISSSQSKQQLIEIRIGMLRPRWSWRPSRWEFLRLPTVHFLSLHAIWISIWCQSWSHVYDNVFRNLTSPRRC